MPFLCLPWRRRIRQSECRQVDSKQKGDITEIRCKLAFMELGINVLDPYGDRERYDFVINIGGKFYRIQSKTSRAIDDGRAFQFNCKRSTRIHGRNADFGYTQDEIDYFVTAFDGKCYMVPVGECVYEKTLRLRPAIDKDSPRISWASDYEIEKIVASLKKSLHL